MYVCLLPRTAPSSVPMARPGMAPIITPAPAAWSGLKQSPNPVELHDPVENAAAVARAIPPTAIPSPAPSSAPRPWLVKRTSTMLPVGVDISAPDCGWNHEAESAASCRFLTWTCLPSAREIVAVPFAAFAFKVWRDEGSSHPTVRVVWHPSSEKEIMTVAKNVFMAVLRLADPRAGQPRDRRVNEALANLAEVSTDKSDLLHSRRGHRSGTALQCSAPGPPPEMKAGADLRPASASTIRPGCPPIEIEDEVLARFYGCRVLGAQSIRTAP